MKERRVGSLGLVKVFSNSPIVRAGLDPAIHDFLCCLKTWMPGTFSAKTRFALLPGHDGTLDNANATACSDRTVFPVPSSNPHNHPARSMTSPHARSRAAGNVSRT